MLRSRNGFTVGCQLQDSTQRILMTLSNSEKILDSMYYEADTIYIGAKTEEKPRNGASIIDTQAHI